MYEKTYTSLISLTFVPVQWQLAQFYYNKTWDAVFGSSGNSGQWFRIFHDGSYVPYGNVSGSWYHGHRVGGLPVFLSGSNGAVYGSFEVNGMPDYNVDLNPLFRFTNANGFNPSGAVWFIDDVNQVFVWRYSYNRFDVRSLVDGSLIRSITHNLNIGFSHLAWAGAGQLCAIRPGAYYTDPVGKVIFFDYLGAEGVLEKGSIESARLATYDCLCRVILSYGFDNKVRVYVRDAIPAVLAAPTFVTTPVRGARAHEVKVRLTGSVGEPSVGWWIHWGLEASGGVGPYGSLAKFVSKTDQNGYAWNTYFGPMGGETGATVLKTWVLV